MAPLETFELGISVFSFDEDYTYSLLEPVFSGLCHGADYERLSEKNQKRFSSELDKCHLQSIDPADCDGYIDSLLQLCSVITRECTGKDFQQWQLGERLSLSYEKHGDILCILFQSEILTGKTCRI